MMPPLSVELPRRTRIKVCGITDLSALDTAVSCGVDAVGFVCYPPSPRAVKLDQAARWAAQLPAFVTPVVLLVNPSSQKVQEVIQAIPQVCLQFHGDQSPAQCQALAAGRPFLSALRIPADAPPGSLDWSQITQDYAACAGWLLDTHVATYGGQGQCFNWAVLPAQCQASLILAGGLNVHNVGQAVAQLRTITPYPAVDVSSGVESTPGIKDPVKIAAFVQAVRTADNTP
jgi:phosphoribosylanthranilate isomerase